MRDRGRHVAAEGCGGRSRGTQIGRKQLPQLHELGTRHAACRRQPPRGRGKTFQQFEPIHGTPQGRELDSI
jgi:hypothetical protein